MKINLQQVQELERNTKHKKLRKPMTEQQNSIKIDKTYFEDKFSQPSVKFELKSSTFHLILCARKYFSKISSNVILNQFHFSPNFTLQSTFKMI